MRKRAAIRQRADEEKAEMVKKVEQMKKQGNFDKEQLAALGINVRSVDDIESNDDFNREIGDTLNQDSLFQESKQSNHKSQLSYQQRSKSHMTDTERREIIDNLKDK